MQPLRQRTINITSTALVLKSFEPTRVNVISAAVDTTHFNLDSGSSAVNDEYNGLAWMFRSGTGVGQNGHVDDYTGATKQVILLTANALVTQPSTDTTFVLGPGLPSAFTSLTIGGAANDIYYSMRAGGTSGTNRFKLGGGQYRQFENFEFPQMKLLEILSSVATDTLTIEYT